MTDDRVDFEFFYDYGTDYGYFHHGWLPRAEFDALAEGRAPTYIRIRGLAYWDKEERKFVSRPPTGSESNGDPFFRTDHLTRLWPVTRDAAAKVERREEAPTLAPNLRRKIEEFFGGPLEQPRLLQETIVDSDLPNLELAIADFLKRESKTSTLLGVQSNDSFDYQPGLRRLIARRSSEEHESEVVRAGPPEWKRQPVDQTDYRDCLSRGVHLIETKQGKAAVAVWPQRMMGEGSTTLEVLSPDEAFARKVWDDLRDGMARLNIYRGKIIELRPARATCGYEVGFASLRVPDRAEIILPDGLLELVERNAFSALRHRKKLLEAGRHLRRGLLFHGKPGTGKTLTARYLVGQLKNYTVVLLTGPSLGLLPQACRVARALSPSAVIIEDVDLIARERGENEYASLLHNLLDEMDGLSPKIEMVFVMTTNRPEMLEPALASRPGRVDQAVEFPLPDRKARRRLFELFSKGMPLASKLDGFIERTEGASGAFIEELLRRALVFSSEEGAPKVLDSHLTKAMQELVMAGGELTQNLLGFARPATRKKR